MNEYIHFKRTYMTYTQDLTLDLNSNAAYPTVSAKQNDVDSRILHIHYTKDGAEYLVNHNNSVALRVRKPDSTLAFISATVDYDGTVYVTLSQQCLTVAGRAYADLVEFNAAGQMLSTVSFIINIMASPDVMGGEAISSDDFQYLKSFIDRGNQVIGEAEEWAVGYYGDTQLGPSSSTTIPGNNNNAKYWSEEASRNGEAWSVGTRDGAAVPSSDPAYNNYAKYWSQQAEISRQKIEDMTASASQLAYDLQPTVTKTEQSGVVNLHFGIPKSNAAYVMFDLDYTDGILYMFRPDSGALTDELTWSVNAKGELEVTFQDDSE